MRRAWLLSLAFVAMAAGAGWAVDEGADAGRTPVPHPPRGRGEHCIAATDVMRRNHMTMLMHQRRETVRLGVRGKPASLAGCIDCHAVRGADGAAVTYADPRHFCRSCHGYVAVSIDCFECHASRPGDSGKTAALDIDAAALAAPGDGRRERRP